MTGRIPGLWWPWPHFILLNTKVNITELCGSFESGEKDSSRSHSRRLTCWALALTLLTGLPSPAAPIFTNGVPVGTIAIPELDEASGLIASRNNADVLWVHNDSGNPVHLFAVDTQGRTLGIYTPTGASNTDWEDIGIGPGPVTNVQYLYLGDIGDNNENRSNIKIYQIPEPAVHARQYTNPVTANMKGVRTLTLTYPDGAHNAESLFVDPWTGDLFIVTKEAATSRVYTAPKSMLDTNNSSALTFVRTIPFDIPSAADISPAGTEIIIRQENFARLWARSPGQTVSNALAGTPVSLPVIGPPTEANGEAVAFDALGGGYFTVSESATPEPLYYFARTSRDGPRAPQVLVPAGAAWKYFDQGTDQGAAWRHPGFNDAAWSNGVAQLGYGNGDEQTVVGYGGNATNKHVTTYFRKTFEVDNAPCMESLTLKLVVDDGAAVYLNETNVLNFQLAPNAAYNTLASATQSTNLEDTWFSFPVAPGLLVNGTNTLAVEIHQAAVNSSDLSFDLQLTAMESTTPRFTGNAFGLNGYQLTLCGPSTTNVTVQATTNFAAWTIIGSVVLTNGKGTLSNLQATNHPQRFYRAVR